MVELAQLFFVGVTTIAGGNLGRGGHVDGPSEDAKFSSDFDVVYIGSSCSLLIIDRGNQAIREIQLHFDDCAYQYGSGFPLGIVVLVAAGFFGYMLAMLQRRVGTMVSSQDDLETRKQSISLSPYQKPPKSSLRPPLIPTGDEQENQEDGVFGSLTNLFMNAETSFTEIVGGLFGYRKKPLKHQNQYQNQRSNSWPLQESFVIPDEDEPPSIETRTPTPKKTYAFMAKTPEKTHHVRPSRAYSNGWNSDLHQNQKQQQQQQQHYRRHYSTSSQTYYEPSCETTKEVLFGAVQEDQQKTKSQVNFMGHPYDYY